MSSAALLAGLAASSCAPKEHAVTEKPAALTSPSQSAEGAAPRPSASASATPLGPEAEASRKACEEENDGIECFGLGYMYENGRNAPKDEARAAALYQKACEAGYGPPCFNLGRMYT